VAIDPHDLDTKVKRARQFLEKGDKVKFTIIFRGREITKPELGEKVVRQITTNLADIGELESPPSRMGKQLHMIMGRRKDYVPPKGEKKQPEPAAE
jgi:translation initiation factor IF-3